MVGALALDQPVRDYPILSRTKALFTFRLRALAIGLREQRQILAITFGL